MDGRGRDALLNYRNRTTLPDYDERIPPSRVRCTKVVFVTAFARRRKPTDPTISREANDTLRLKFRDSAWTSEKERANEVTTVRTIPYTRFVVATGTRTYRIGPPVRFGLGASVLEPNGWTSWNVSRRSSFPYPPKTITITTTCPRYRYCCVHNAIARARSHGDGQNGVSTARPSLKWLLFTDGIFVVVRPGSRSPSREINFVRVYRAETRRSERQTSLSRPEINCSRTFQVRRRRDRFRRYTYLYWTRLKTAASFST